LFGNGRHGAALPLDTTRPNGLFHRRPPGRARLLAGMQAPGGTNLSRPPA
jgi:hypothetical protein